MLRKKLSESLTGRIFIITLFILLLSGLVTFALIAYATPSTYTAVLTDDLARKAGELALELSATPFEESGTALDEFIRTSGADAMLMDPDGRTADNGSTLAVRPLYEDDSTVVTEAGSGTGTDVVTWNADGSVAVTMAEQETISVGVTFPNREGEYMLYVFPRLQSENLAVRALIEMAPWLLLALLAFSLLCALIYSRYVTRPIVRLSGIASRLANLDFGWKCANGRRDEIGQLGRSLDELSQKLGRALSELESANTALRGEVEREREADRSRMAFFAAASHELKTPVTILKGQLTGMLDGVGVYQDRDKYLARSLMVTSRMESLVGEILTISRLESQEVLSREEANLSALVREQLELMSELMEQRALTLKSELRDGIAISCERALLGKAIGNLISNAALYSPEGADVRVRTYTLDERAALSIENTGVHIDEGALPHLFDAFYRADKSRSRSTGGSGLGLYLSRIIFERHGAECKIENTPDGVLATVVFAP